MQYDWPGNIRELKSVLERTVILHQGGRLSFDLSSHAESKADGTPRQEPCEELFKNLPTHCRAGIFSMCSRSPTGVSPGTGGRCAFWA